MKDIQELAYIIHQHNLSIYNSNGLLVEKDTLLWRFYKGIVRGEISSDEEAEKTLYPDEIGGGKYRQLKSSLRDRMLSSIINFEAKSGEFTDYQRAYYACHKEWLTIKILIGQNANTAAMGVAIKLLKQVQRYEFTLITLDIAAYLSYQFGLRESNDRKFKEANALYTHCLRLNEVESLAEQLYTQLMVKVVNNRTANEAVSLLAADYYSRIETDLKQFSSYRLHLYGNMIHLMQFSSVNKYEEVLPICDRVISFFEQKPYEARVPLQMFYYQKMICYIQLRRFEEGKNVAQYCLSLINEGNFNWFKYMELYLKLAFYTEEYSKGVQILKESMTHPRFQFLPDNTKELWRIYESFAYLLFKVNKVSNFGSSTFKLNKFINETPIFSKDKSGMNIAIIVVRMLLLLAEKRYQQVLDDVEGLDRYCSRYLSGKNTYRSSNFIKMLLQIPLGQFDVEAIKPKAARYLKNLADFPIQVANQTSEIEVLPYELLWEIALETLE